MISDTSLDKRIDRLESKGGPKTTGMTYPNGAVFSEIVGEVSLELATDFWCLECGDHFEGMLTLLGQEGCFVMVKTKCVHCGEDNTLPHVVSGSVILPGSGPMLVLEAIRYAMIRSGK